MGTLFLHRKLMSDINSTSFDCEQFCLAACDNLCLLLCSDICYDPSDNCPPPAPAPAPIPSDDVSPKKSTQFLLIIVFTVLGGSFLVLCFSALYLRFYRNGFNGSRPETTETGNGFINEDRGPIIDHPIWYINTVGLQPSMIESIEVCKYKTGEGLVEGTECSVCLNDFKDGETVKLLPKCNHAFHVSCIDTWLRSHTNCPMCRAPVVSNNEDRINEVNTRNYGVTSHEEVNEELRPTGETSEVRVVVDEEKIEYSL